MGRHALLIGNSQYTDDKLQRLTAPEVDVSQLADVLEDPEIGRFDTMQLLEDQTESAVRRAIARFFNKRKRDDLLLFYFSGHGVRDEDGHLYFAVRDTENDYLDATAIAARYVTRQMDRSRSRRQVLILDCCHSGAFARGVKRGTRVGSGDIFEGTGTGRVVLTATDETQFAWEGNRIIGEAQGSLFTHFLLEGLRTGNADANRDGTITVDELYEYAYERVLEHTPNQTPYKWDYRRRGDIVLAQAQRTSDKPPGWFAPDIPYERINDTRIICKVDGKEMIFIPEGEFLFGSSDKDESAYDHEKPQQRIHLHAFWIDMTPVTNAEYKRFIDANLTYRLPRIMLGGEYNWKAEVRTFPGGKAEHPVVLVSRADAAAYAGWAGKQLPTEQEWEKAARGTDGRRYPWGNEWKVNHCNSKDSGIGGTSPVGQFSPQGDSPFGCIDMSGNVNEWVASSYNVRGGMWDLHSHYCRTAYRDFILPTRRNRGSGFRCIVRRPPSQ